MSANIEEVVVSARTFPNVLALPLASRIGNIEIETTLEEMHTETLEVTEHPVESGSAITDHSYRKPSEIVLRCGWSNASLKALHGIVKGLASDATMLQSNFVPDSNTRSEYVGGIYSQLLKLQRSREPISITTTLRLYENMLITGLQVTRDRKTSQVLMVTATCREVLIVRTQSAMLPPQEAQADPASTAEVVNRGTLQLIPADPAPGGSVPPNEW